MENIASLPRVSSAQCNCLLDDGSCLCFSYADNLGIDVVFNNMVLPLEELIAGRTVVAIW